MYADFRVNGRVGKREGGLREKDKEILLRILGAMRTDDYLEVSQIAKNAQLGVSTTAASLERFRHLTEWKLKTVIYHKSTDYKRERSVNVYRLKPDAIERVRRA